MTKLFTASQVAGWAYVDLKTIHNWVDKGHVTAGRTPGRHLRFKPEDVKKLLEGMRADVPEEVTAACAAG